MRSLLASVAAAVVLAACGGGGGGDDSEGVVPATEPSVQIFDQSTAPRKLSDWHVVFNDGKKLSLHSSAVPYDLNAALFSDYAFKLRAVYLPAGKQIGYTTDGGFDFPIGTIITKTFYYPRAANTDPDYAGVAQQAQVAQGDSIDLTANILVETRVLVLQPSGKWSGLPYVWDAAQQEATLQVGGQDVKLELKAADGSSRKFIYAVPNAQACQQCHATQSAGGAGILPIGPKARNLNKLYTYGTGKTENQLEHLDTLRLLAGYTGLASAPVNADWRDASQPIESRARAYLDINCAHCHSARGAAFQSGLLLDYDSVGKITTSTTKWGVCKSPLAYAGPGGLYRYDIEPGAADVSLLLYRLSTTTTGEVMPPISRKVNHADGIALIRDWINQIAMPPCDPVS
ncbi:hypothetical protein BH10PSE17_BH10PSE17_09190 [soil metagenome]